MTKILGIGGVGHLDLPDIHDCVGLIWAQTNIVYTLSQSSQVQYTRPIKNISQHAQSTKSGNLQVVRK